MLIFWTGVSCFSVTLFYSTLLHCGGKANLVRCTLFYSTLLPLTDRQNYRWRLKYTRFAWAGGTFFPVVLLCCVSFCFWREMRELALHYFPVDCFGIERSQAKQVLLPPPAAAAATTTNVHGCAAANALTLPSSLPCRRSPNNSTAARCHFLCGNGAGGANYLVLCTRTQHTLLYFFLSVKRAIFWYNLSSRHEIVP